MADADGRLRELAAMAAELGAEGLAADAEALAERVGEGRFYLACVGQFKRGKSTLLNALIGDRLLPTGVVPVTAVVTVVRHGEHRSARIRQAGRPWRAIDPAMLADYVTEARNPGNRLAVQAVEVFVPAPLLASGLCLVDTPGLGSVFGDNTEVTRRFVPQIDAALVVVGADPPISGDELALVDEVAAWTDQVIVVLNKADRLADAEREEARHFAEQVLRQRLGRPVRRIFEVSATDALAGETTRDWKALEAALDALAREAGTRLVREATERGVDRLADRLAHVIDEHRQALTRPLDESERRIGALRRAVADAERALADLGPLFSAEQARLARAFAAEREAFLGRALPAAARRLAESAAADAGGPRRGVQERALARARALARESVEGWLHEVEPRAEVLYREGTQRFVELAGELLTRLAGPGCPLAGLPTTVPAETAFRAPRRFHFTELLTVARAGPLRWLWTRLAPRRLAAAAAYRVAEEYLERLVRSNSARVANDLADRVGESRRALESDLGRVLGEVASSAEHALEQARRRQAAGAGAVRAELDRLDDLRDRLAALRGR